MKRYEILIGLNCIEDMSNIQIAANNKFIRETARAAYEYIKSLPEAPSLAEKRAEGQTAEEWQQGG